MRRTLATLSLVCAVLAPTMHASDWSEVVKQVAPSVAWANIDSEGGCTAFVINVEKHYLMTAGHCFPGDKGILWIDNVPATVVMFDQKHDIMVVAAKDLDPAKPALKLAAKNPVIGQEVMSVGYGFALERPFFRQAHVQDDAMAISGIEGGPFISTDSPFVGGQSGGPVVNAAGEIVAIVQRGDNGTTGLGVGVETIRKYAGRFFGTK